LRAVFLSDVHLVREDTDKTGLVQEFLKDCCADADMIFILGDLFEFYHGYDEYVYPWYKSVIDTLRALTKSGKQVFFLEGNHEFSMGVFFEQYTGITCRQDMTIHLDDKKVFVSHGDASGLFCLGSILKTRFIYAIMDILGPLPTWKAATMAGFFLSRKVKPYNNDIKNIFRENARKKLDEGYDAVIYAHSHIADKIEFDGKNGKKTYLNTGDFGKCLDYVLYDSNSDFTQERYNRKVTKEKRSMQRGGSET
jgi:UDP-2,3-diacylglucosamine hydrolase